MLKICIFVPCFVWFICVLFSFWAVCLEVHHFFRTLWTTAVSNYSYKCNLNNVFVSAIYVIYLCIHLFTLLLGFYCLMSFDQCSVGNNWTTSYGASRHVSCSSCFYSLFMRFEWTPPIEEGKWSATLPQHVKPLLGDLFLFLLEYL